MSEIMFYADTYNPNIYQQQPLKGHYADQPLLAGNRT